MTTDGPTILELCISQTLDMKMTSGDDHFTTIGKRGKPLLVKLEQPGIEPELESTQSVRSEVAERIYHPDFTAPTTPFDVLFKTEDGMLFWFSLPLLTCYSRYFAAIDWDTLRRPDGLKTRSGCIHIPTSSSNGFSLILHTLHLDYHQRRLDAILETSRELSLPDHILDNTSIDAYHQALDIARSFRIDSFIELIGRHLLIPELCDHMN